MTKCTVPCLWSWAWPWERFHDGTFFQAGTAHRYRRIASLPKKTFEKGALPRRGSGTEYPAPVAEVQYHLRKARRGLDDLGDQTLTTVIHEIRDQLEWWPHQALNLVDTRNWRMDELLEEGKQRKPRIYLSVQITRRQNLALDWFPRQVLDPSFSGPPEFVHWSDGWPAGSQHLPFNRLVMIREFGHLRRAERGRFGRAADRKLHAEALEHTLRATRKLLEEVRDFTARVCNVRVRNWLYLETLEESRRRPWRISDAEDEKSRVEALRRAEWRAKRIEQRFGFSAEELIRAFRKTGGHARETAELLQPQCSTGVVITPEVVRRLSERLYTEHVELWDSFCPDLIPQGCARRPRAKVVPIRPEA